MSKSQNEIVDGVSEQVQWWVEQRRTKLIKLRHQSHAINPFLWPIIKSMHGFRDLRELVAFQLAGHLVEGHATGFGKLVDEKILSHVFGTTKLDRKFREINSEYQNHAYDNIDHLMMHSGKPRDLLSLKAGRWSIQLGQAVQLNRSFQALLDRRANEEIEFDRLVVGVFYGTNEGLTDKYRIIQGLETSAQHDITDISEHVDVYAGREFWSWINGGERNTQEWVLLGIELGYELAAEENGPLDESYEAFISDFESQLKPFLAEDGTIDWVHLLRDING